jgi:transcriptional regulator with XRE-family HTH domain
MSLRTSKVLPTKEGRLLRKLRKDKKLSMRSLAQAVGVTDSYIAQMETGRANAPKGETLYRMLMALGTNEKAFKERLRNFKEDRTDAEVITDLLKRMNKNDIKMFRQMMEAKCNLASNEFIDPCLSSSGCAIQKIWLPNGSH